MWICSLHFPCPVSVATEGGSVATRSWDEVGEALGLVSCLPWSCSVVPGTGQLCSCALCELPGGNGRKASEGYNEGFWHARCHDNHQGYSFESIKLKTVWGKSWMHRTWTVSSPFANQWGFFANQSLISQLFLPFLLIQKLVCGSPSVLVHPLWQMACHWQQYAANPMLCSSSI